MCAPIQYLWKFPIFLGAENNSLYFLELLQKIRKGNMYELQEFWLNVHISTDGG